MVAPITEPMNKNYQSAKVQVWFPEGKWYDFFTGREYAGDVVLDIYRDIESIPVFAKEGVNCSARWFWCENGCGFT